MPFFSEFFLWIVISMVFNFNEERYVKDFEHVLFYVFRIFDGEGDQLWYHNKLLDEVIDIHVHLKRKKNKKIEIVTLHE